ncbi:MAG TPA: response regulator transcription factor [Steroidobacteraceae bacterium]|jgi:DNA-binding NarL/FixJ family response regulator
MIEVEAPTPRVLIADDHPLYCDALRAVVSQAIQGAEVHAAESQEAVLAAVRTGRFNLVLLDLNLPGAAGLSCLHALKKLATDTPIVVVSAVGDPKVMQDTVMAGASAFIPKSAPGQVLIHALKVIIAGGTYMPTGVVAALRNAAQNPVNGELTLRQRRVLELLATGLSNKRIARELKISEITVKAHVSAIFRKLGVTNRTQAGLEARKLLDTNY